MTKRIKTYVVEVSRRDWFFESGWDTFEHLQFANEAKAEAVYARKLAKYKNDDDVTVAFTYDEVFV